MNTKANTPAYGMDDAQKDGHLPDGAHLIGHRYTENENLLYVYTESDAEASTLRVARRIIDPTRHEEVRLSTSMVRRDGEWFMEFDVNNVPGLPSHFEPTDYANVLGVVGRWFIEVGAEEADTLLALAD